MVTIEDDSDQTSPNPSINRIQRLWVRLIALVGRVEDLVQKMFPTLSCGLLLFVLECYPIESFILLSTDATNRYWKYQTSLLQSNCCFHRAEWMLW